MFPGPRECLVFSIRSSIVLLTGMTRLVTFGMTRLAAQNSANRVPPTGNRPGERSIVPLTGYFCMRFSAIVPPKLNPAT